MPPEINSINNIGRNSSSSIGVSKLIEDSNNNSEDERIASETTSPLTFLEINIFSLLAVPRSQNELAFMTLFDLSEEEYALIREFCHINENDELDVLMKKVSESEDVPAITGKVKNSIHEYVEYKKLKDQLYRMLLIKNSAQFEEETSKILVCAFKETLKLFEDSAELKEYFQILKKYKITDPLKVSRDVLNKMNILEETKFNNTTMAIKNFAVSNLNFEEMQEYLDYNKFVSQRFEVALTKAITENKSEYMAIRERELKAEKILDPQLEEVKPILTVLTNEAQNIIKNFQQALTDLKLALQTEGIEDDKSVQEKLAKIKEELLKEIEKEYQNAFEDTPTEPEKQALKALLRATAELEIIDEKIIFYTRLSNSALSSEERIIIKEIKERGEQFSQTNIDPLVYKTANIDDLIKNYPARTHAILKECVQAVRKYLTDASDASKSLINSGREHSQALYFALLGAGFSEKELLLFDAVIAYEFLNPQMKEMLTGTAEEQIRICLKELKRLNELIYSESFKSLSDAEKGKINQETESLFLIISGLAGTLIDANYLCNLDVSDTKLGGLLEAQYFYAETTPEENDDYLMREKFKECFKRGGEQFGLNPWSIISTHIYVRKIIGEPIDEEFVNELIKYSSLYGLMAGDGQYGLDEFKKIFIECFINQSLENTLKEKPNYNSSKARLLDWIKHFIGDIKSTLGDDFSDSCLDKMHDKVGILGSIYDTLLQSKIMSEDELEKFFSENPLIPCQTDLTIEDLEKVAVFRTVGFENLPKEIKQSIEKSGSAEFLKQNEDLLNVYWVPDNIHNNFVGYATRDRNTIVVETRTQPPQSVEELTGTLIHELRHKVDAKEFKNYCRQNPNYEAPYLWVPSLITERNASLTELEYFEKIPRKTKEIKEELKRSKDIVVMANLLLGFPEDSRMLLHPPYEGINDSAPMDIHPREILLDEKGYKKILKIIDNLGYRKDEKQWLLEYCLSIFADGTFDLSNVRIGNRYLFIDFLGKLIAKEATNTKGYLTEDFYSAIENIKAQIQDESGYGVVSANLLAYLLFGQKSQ